LAMRSCNAVRAQQTPQLTPTSLYSVSSKLRNVSESWTRPSTKVLSPHGRSERTLSRQQNGMQQALPVRAQNATQLLVQSMRSVACIAQNSENRQNICVCSMRKSSKLTAVAQEVRDSSLLGPAMLLGSELLDKGAVVLALGNNKLMSACNAQEPITCHLVEVLNVERNQVLVRTLLNQGDDGVLVSAQQASLRAHVNMIASSKQTAELPQWPCRAARHPLRTALGWRAQWGACA
jgi:hypothetical protein